MSDSTPATDTVQSSRRKLMKALAVTGVAASAGLLPGQWLKPIVEMGVLPAHANVTGTLTITSVTITLPANLGAIMGDSPNAEASCPRDPSECERRMNINYISSQPLICNSTYVTASTGINSTDYFSYGSNLIYNGQMPISSFLMDQDVPACIVSTQSGSGIIYGLFDGIDGMPFDGTQGQLACTCTVRSGSQTTSNTETSEPFETEQCPS